MPRAAGLLLALAAATPLKGQAVRGQLVTRGGGAPVEGAFLVLLDQAGVEVARVLTGESGTFLLRAPGAGIYRLRSKRIGFRAWESEPIALADSATAHFHLEVEAVPVRLPPVVVAGTPQCGTQGDAGSVVAQLWEEAREALAAVRWIGGQRSHTYTLERFQRQRSAPGEPVRSERRSTRSGQFERPFGAIAAEELARRGYVAASSADSVDYFGPDADVLLGDPFVETHCFTARSGGPERPGVVGLVFQPVPGRSLPDVEGVLWIGTRDLELQLLEFMRLPSGPWVVKQWWIRTPRLGRRRYPSPNVLGYRETGGLVLSIASDTNVIYSVPRRPD